jgi:Cu/Ag efflux pump CusA
MTEYPSGLLAGTCRMATVLAPMGDRFCGRPQYLRSNASTIAIVMGLVPLALNIEEGGDMLQPMAVGAIGGLIMLIPVALFLMPSIFVIFTREQARVRS